MAEMFDDGDRFTRRGGLPLPTLSLLQDQGSVIALDGEDHRHRKAMILSLMGEAEAERLARLAEEEWRRRLPHWEREGEINLFDEAREILFRSACAWAGVPLREDEVGQRLYETAEMVESSGKVGPRNWRAQILRSRHEAWARRIVEGARSGNPAPPGSALAVIAAHRDRQDQLLDVPTAAVEIINVIRPTQAVARFVVFAALALHRRPETVPRLREGDPAYLAAFAEEVRRMAPFIPMIGGRAREGFDWRGLRVAKGDWVLIDLFATDRHPDLWAEPESFRPERFLDRAPTAYDLIPQGAGNPATGHRCPGEAITLALVRMAARMLARDMRYEVPKQDLRVDLRRIPALPASGMILRGVTAVRDRIPH
jgi:fatty-acid peroxygenase